MVGTRNKLYQPKPKWLGKRRRCTKPNPLTGGSTTYEGFQFNDITAYVGDFVLVSNADANEPDTLEGCDVARIEHLFESTTLKGDKYRANVQWYSKPSQILKSIDNQIMDDRYEVFEDCRKFDSNVSIETVFQKCSVINAYQDDIPREVYLANREFSPILFVCRYRLCQKKSKYYVEPVLELDEMMLDPEDVGSSSGNHDAEKRESKYMPNEVIFEKNESEDGSRRTRETKERYKPLTPKSRGSSLPKNESENKLHSKLRSALRKCSIDSDSGSSKTSSKTKNPVVSGVQDSDFENSPESTPRKNPPRNSKRHETPLKSNGINTLGLKSSNYLNIDENQSQSISKNNKTKISSNSNDSPNHTPRKTRFDNSIRKRKASRSSSEESFEPRSPSISPKINYTGPPAAYKLYETKGHTLIIKKPIDIEKKASKKLDDSTITDLLSSEASDSEDILEILKKSGTKIVARSKPDNKGFELLNTPNKNVGILENIAECTDQTQTPKSARRNLSDTLDMEDTRHVNKDLLLKKIADKREDASLKIKLRRSTEQSTYKIDSDSDSNANTRSRRRTTTFGTPTKSILKMNSKTPGTPSVKFSNDNETKEYSPTTELSKKLQKVEIKLKRVEPEVRKSPRNRKANSRYADYYEVVKSPITNNETPKKRTRKSVNYNADDDTPLETERKTRSSRTKIVEKDAEIANEEPKTPRRSRRTVNTDDLPTPNKKDSKMDYEETESATPKRKLNTPKLQTPSRSVKTGLLTPSMKQRNKRVSAPSTPLQEARARLHVSAVPKSLPCREEEFNNIYTFLEGKLKDNSGGCLYISGVPGTGKTATVNEVIRCLKKTVSKKKLDNFDFVEINAMKLTEPRQAYVEILKQLTGKKATWEQAHQLLDKRFTTAAPRRLMTLLLVDELDILCNKRQDVVYNLLDWPAKSSAQLVVITIANTMDLPERVLMGRVTSRLGLTRLTFQPYTHKQLQEIVTTRLNESHAFKSEAIQLVARKVAAVSGDARRALDICRRATEVAETNNSEIVTMRDVNEALTEMIASVKVQAIRHCSEMEQTFLQAVCAEVARTGVEEVVFKNIYSQLSSLCLLEGLEEPSVTEAITICAKLGAYRLLICEHSRADIHQRVLLNVSSDDVHFALQNIEV